MPSKLAAASVYRSGVPSASPGRTSRRIAYGVFLASYFAWFSRPTLSVHFAADDMMNIAGYWRIKPLQLLLAQVMPWRPYYRPMGGLVYLSLFHGFGLNPVPYHLVLLFILFANACLVYRLAVLLAGGEIAAGLAAMAVCYHAGIHTLYYNTAFTYDALCCMFYLAAFVCYLQVRAQGRLPGARATIAVLLLHLCALNSKEMAATFPAILLIYEWIYHRPCLDTASVRAWLRGEGRVPLLATGLTLIFCYGHLVRQGGLMQDPAYRPVLNWDQIVDFQSRSLGDLLIRPDPVGVGAIVGIWLVFTYLAWRRNRPILRLCWWYMVITPLPIEVLRGRAGACLAIPYAGLAVSCSVVFVDVCRAAADFFAGEPLFRRFARSHLFAAAVVLGAATWAWYNSDFQERYIRPIMTQLGQTTWDAIRQLNALNPRASRNAEIVFLHDPFNGYDMQFITELWFRDRSLNIRLARESPVSPEDLAHAERVFDFRDGKLVQLR
jgi:hypothetical protein